MDELEMSLALMLGPLEGGPSEGQLHRGWRAFRDELMRDRADGGRVAGSRPWAYWHFELGEDPPEELDEQTVRLAEIGKLTAREAGEVRGRGPASKAWRLMALRGLIEPSSDELAEVERRGREAKSTLDARIERSPAWRAVRTSPPAST